MPPQTRGRAETGVVVDRNSNTIVLQRTFAASREQVFEAWTRPEHVAHWWDPAGARLIECEIDLRPGGHFKFVSQGNLDFPFAGIYRKIVAPQQLVFDAMGSTGSVILESAGGNTHLTVTIACGSAAQLDQFLKMGVDVGTAQTLDNLVAYVGAIKP
jgi:uncharacterized protein YndB with AHSA1/START domain